MWSPNSVLCMLRPELLTYIYTRIHNTSLKWESFREQPGGQSSSQGAPAGRQPVSLYLLGCSLVSPDVHAPRGPAPRRGRKQSANVSIPALSSRGPGLPDPPGPHPGNRPLDSPDHQILPPRPGVGSPSSPSFPLPLRFPPSALPSSAFFSLTLSSEATAPPPNP